MCAIIEIKENCLNNNYDYYFLCASHGESVSGWEPVASATTAWQT